VTTSVVEPSFGRGGSNTTAPDAEILAKLSSLYVALRRHKRQAASASEHLRRQRGQIAQVEALLQSDSAALYALRADPEPDRVTLNILDEAVAGERVAYEAATRDIACWNDTAGSGLRRTINAITTVEREAMELRRALSPTAARLLDGLLRKKTLPLVSYVSGRLCGECHLGLPTALASAVRKAGALQWCPHCKRVLLERPGEAGAPKVSK